MKKILADYKHLLEENCSYNTALAYMGDLLRFIEENGITTKKSLVKLKSKDVSDYILLLKSRGMAYSSVSRTVASLKKFFDYCRDNGIIAINFTDEIERPKITRNLPNTLTNEDVVKLLEAPDVTTLKGIRDRAMLEFMYATGARVSEVIGLKTGDVSLKNELVVLTSGKKRRFVPLGKVAIDTIYAYMKDCRPEIASADSGDVFFLNLHGQPLTRQGFWKIIKTYITEVGIDSDVTAQTLRHSFALHLLSNGADIQSVSEMLGYSDVSSTKIYLEVMNNKIKEVYKNAHPRA